MLAGLRRDCGRLAAPMCERRVFWRGAGQRRQVTREQDGEWSNENLDSCPDDRNWAVTGENCTIPSGFVGLYLRPTCRPRTLSGSWQGGQEGGIGWVPACLRNSPTRDTCRKFQDRTPSRATRSSAGSLCSQPAPAVKTPSTHRTCFPRSAFGHGSQEPLAPTRSRCWPSGDVLPPRRGCNPELRADHLARTGVCSVEKKVVSDG